MTEQVFTVGKRYKALISVAMLLNVGIVLTFYFIYSNLLKDTNMRLISTALPVIFMVLGVLIVRLTLWVFRRYAKSVCYRVREQELVVGSGDAQRYYPWHIFTAACLDSRGAYRLDTVLPVTFHIAGQTLQINQYTGDIYRLTDEILIHISPYATVDPALKSQVSAMRGAF